MLDRAMMQRFGWIGKATIDRRSLLKGGAIGLASLAGWERLGAGSAWAATAIDQTVLEQLLAGNQRFVSATASHPHASINRRLKLAQSQSPIATILSCADSRVPAELLFDTGLGDLFNVRVAGNVATPAVLGSLEYGAAVLKTPLLIVLGHERCGAVTAAVQGKPLPGSIPEFVDAIKPAVVKTAGLTEADRIEATVVANIRLQRDLLLARSSLVRDLVAKDQIQVVAARYDLDSGLVRVLD
jgi:carbonic anhydrase